MSTFHPTIYNMIRKFTSPPTISRQGVLFSASSYYYSQQPSTAADSQPRSN